MRRRKFLITLSFIVGAMLIGVVFIAGKTASLAKEEKKAFDFNNVEAPHLMRAEGLPIYETGIANEDNSRFPLKGATSLVAQNLIQNLLGTAKEGKIKSSGQDKALDILSNTDAMNNAVANLAENLNLKLKTSADIKLITDNSEARQKKYAEDFAKISAANPALPHSPEKALQAALKEKNPAPAQAIADYFYRIADKYLGLEVPPAAAKFHLWSMNYLLKTGWAFELLADSPEDPFKGVMAIELLAKLPVEEAKSLQSLLKQP